MRMTTAVPSLLCLTALAACSSPIERFEHANGFLPEKPATQFPRVGDVWVVQSRGTKSVRMLQCRNDRPPRIFESPGEDQELSSNLKVGATQDATATVNAALAAAAIKLPVNAPQVDATVKSNGQYVRNAATTITGMKFQMASLDELRKSYDALVSPTGSCASALEARHVYIVQATLAADVTYTIDWNTNFGANMQAQLADAAKASLDATVVTGGGKHIKGASLVYGVRLVDPKNQYRLITEFAVGWDGLGTQIRGGTTD